MTATPARIALCVRESEFARVSDPAVLARRSDARDGFEQVIDSFFDKTAHAQAFLNQRFNVLKLDRRKEAVEADEPLRIGVDVPITPALPRARLRDRLTALDRVMIIKAMSIDFNIEKNSVENIG